MNNKGFALIMAILVIVLFAFLGVLVLVGGWMAYRSLPVDAFPDVSPVLVQVFTVT